MTQDRKAQHRQADQGPAGDRGRRAGRPKDVPWPGWRDILMRVLKRTGEDNITLIAAGIAFNAMFALFPAIIVFVSVYGYFVSPGDISAHIKSLYSVLPPDAANLVKNSLQNVAGRSTGTLSFGAAVSFGIMLYSSAQGMWALATATNVAYQEREQRGFLKLLGMAVLFTLGGLAGVLLLVGLGFAVPYAVDRLPFGQFARDIALAVRWILLWALAAFALAVVYRYAPCRREPRWQWVSVGSVVAASLWLAGSLLFSLYVQDFGSYGKTYGALGGVMVLLMWFYLGSFAVLLGAELNAQIEHQTGHDTTTGPPKPMGSRGAHVADTLAEAPEANSGGHEADSRRPPRS